MQKGIFSTTEAQVVAFMDDPKMINLQLYQWKKSADLMRLKRGLFMFSDFKPNAAELAKSLYSPCYFSLEYILSLHNILPEAVFSYTLVTTKKTCRFNTPLGQFIYHHIKKAAFIGFDAETLMADREKALVDYFYLNTSRLKADPVFWQESRLNGAELNFKKVFHYAKLFQSKKLITLLTDFQHYAKTH